MPIKSKSGFTKTSSSGKEKFGKKRGGLSRRKGRLRGVERGVDGASRTHLVNGEARKDACYRVPFRDKVRRKANSQSR